MVTNITTKLAKAVNKLYRKWESLGVDKDGKVYRTPQKRLNKIEENLTPKHNMLQSSKTLSGWSGVDLEGDNNGFTRAVFRSSWATLTFNRNPLILKAGKTYTFGVYAKISKISDVNYIHARFVEGEIGMTPRLNILSTDYRFYTYTHKMVEDGRITHAPFTVGGILNAGSYVCMYGFTVVESDNLNGWRESTQDDYVEGWKKLTLLTGALPETENSNKYTVSYNGGFKTCILQLSIKNVAADAMIAQLPEGYRPFSTLNYPIISQGRAYNLNITSSGFMYMSINELSGTAQWNESRKGSIEVSFTV